MRNFIETAEVALAAVHQLIDADGHWMPDGYVTLAAGTAMRLN